jgi:hypothetical protein
MKKRNIEINLNNFNHFNSIKYHKILKERNKNNFNHFNSIKYYIFFSGYMNGKILLFFKFIKLFFFSVLYIFTNFY